MYDGYVIQIERGGTVKVIVHPRVSERHPEISPRDVEEAWASAWGLGRVALRQDSPNFPEYVCCGFDASGREVEMVGTLTEGGWLVYHAMTPPSGKTRREMDVIARRH